MRVMGIRSNPAAGKGHADSVHGLGELEALLPHADFVALTCPLTPQTEKLINAERLALMKRSAFLINAARGRIVDEPALVRALTSRQIAGAGIDVTVEEPLPSSSPLWDSPNAFITPHTGGETRHYEDNVLDILQENLERLWRDETTLRNQVV
jgi:phosphoglycerate dehydrogenase-like enzyme